MFLGADGKGRCRIVSRGENFDLTLAKTCAKAFASACGVGCVVSDATGEVKYESGCGCASCGVCKAAGRKPDDCVQAHIYGMTEAARFGASTSICVPWA